MTVFVDDMHRTPTGRFGRMKMSHMIADGIGFGGASVSTAAEREAELHAMAARIGMKRRWYQGDHYDVSLSMRALALAAGAVEITWRQAGCMTAIARRTGIMPPPADAERLFRAFLAGVETHLAGMRKDFSSIRNHLPAESEILAETLE